MALLAYLLGLVTIPSLKWGVYQFFEVKHLIKKSYDSLKTEEPEYLELEK